LRLDFAYVAREKRRRILALAAVVLAAALAAIAAVVLLRASPAVALVVYAYDDCGGCFAGDNPCKPCEILEDLQLQYYEILERAGYAGSPSAGSGGANGANGADDANSDGGMRTGAGSVRVVNTRGEAGRSAFADECARLNIDGEAVAFPLVVLNGAECFSGAAAPAQVSQRLAKQGFFPSLRSIFARPKTLLANNEMVYFYSEFCGECIRVEENLESIQALLQESGIGITRYDVSEGDNYTLLTEFLAERGLSHKSASTPYVFWGGGAYHGSIEISQALMEWIDATYPADEYEPSNAAIG